jgi:RNA polymerase sigma-70 factor (ECF subfamily)
LPDAAESRQLADQHDAALLGRMADGDRAALGELYDRFAPTMLALAYRMLGAQREAEDLVHDVFLEIWHRARLYDRQRAGVRTWFLLRVRSRALDRLRSARRAGRVPFDEGLLNTTDARRVDPASVRDGRTLQGILLDLPTDQRTVLELGYFAGYSCAEIARELAIPVGTVKSRMSRAIAQLRLRLQVLEGVES